MCVCISVDECVFVCVYESLVYTYEARCDVGLSLSLSLSLSLLLLLLIFLFFVSGVYFPFFFSSFVRLVFHHKNVTLLFYWRRFFVFCLSSFSSLYCLCLFCVCNTLPQWAQQHTFTHLTANKRTHTLKPTLAYTDNSLSHTSHLFYCESLCIFVGLTRCVCVCCSCWIFFHFFFVRSSHWEWQFSVHFVCPLSWIFPTAIQMFSSLNGST